MYQRLSFSSTRSWSSACTASEGTRNKESVKSLICLAIALNLSINPRLIVDQPLAGNCEAGHMLRNSYVKSLRIMTNKQQWQALRAMDCGRVTMPPAFLGRRHDRGRADLR